MACHCHKLSLFVFQNFPYTYIWNTWFCYRHVNKNFQFLGFCCLRCHLLFRLLPIVRISSLFVVVISNKAEPSICRYFSDCLKLLFFCFPYAKKKNQNHMTVCHTLSLYVQLSVSSFASQPTQLFIEVSANRQQTNKQQQKKISFVCRLQNKNLIKPKAKLASDWNFPQPNKSTHSLFLSLSLYMYKNWQRRWKSKMFWLFDKDGLMVLVMLMVIHLRLFLIWTKTNIKNKLILFLLLFCKILTGCMLAAAGVVKSGWWGLHECTGKIWIFLLENFFHYIKTVMASNNNESCELKNWT